MSYETYVLLCNLTDFLPELLFSLAKTNALKLATLNSNNSFLLRYVQGTSERIRRVLNEAGVGVAMRPVKTIRHILPSPKDPYTVEDKSCVVYKIPCSDCDYVYIGQTKRGLKSRLADHRRATSQLRPELSALCEHAMDFNHTIDWEKSEILKVENNYSKRLISEA